MGLAKAAYSVMKDPSDLGDISPAKELILQKGEITFENVFFNYGGKKLFENKQGGERVGLVGYSGAGKTTFASLILRISPLDQGRILIDGQDIAKVTLESLRKNIALIPQDPVLFHRTLRENIAYGNPLASEEEVLQASKWAHCHEFITAMPQGYETLVGERGAKLSGGEKQRIAIARAFLANSPILILDEATSSLDSLTESLIQESLLGLMKHRTTLVIAHRLSTLANMDRILVFHDGKIVEEGTHDSLLAHKGHYANLWKKQIHF
jgi:ATP-binding cassette subfamily B protein